MLGACYNKYEQEIIVVSKTPRGAYVGEKVPPGYDLAWYEIGLSRNGKEPIEYIWRAVKSDPYSYAIMNSDIGDKGTIFLREWAELMGIKLCRPNAKKPPVIGALGEVSWRKAEPVSDDFKLGEDLGEKGVYDKTSINPDLKKSHIELNGVEYIILQPYIIKNIETGEIIDMRTGGSVGGYKRTESVTQRFLIPTCHRGR